MILSLSYSVTLLRGFTGAADLSSLTRCCRRGHILRSPGLYSMWFFAWVPGRGSETAAAIMRSTIKRSEVVWGSTNDYSPSVKRSNGTGDVLQRKLKRESDC